jgi:hypothetical protein
VFFLVRVNGMNSALSVGNNVSTSNPSSCVLKLPGKSAIALSFHDQEYLTSEKYLNLTTMG